MIALALALAAGQPATPPAVVPTPTASAPAPIDPARQKAATELLDALMPPATRAQMLEGMIRPMMANMTRGLTQDPGFAAAIGSDERVKVLFGEFLEQQNERGLTMLRAGLPGMISAMANAYARHFDVAQLRELKAFFETPTGRAYMRESAAIMSDPDVAEWQRTMAAQSMAHIRTDMADFMKKISELSPKTDKP